jgi:hypothetical protein
LDDGNSDYDVTVESRVISLSLVARLEPGGWSENSSGTNCDDYFIVSFMAPDSHSWAFLSPFRLS